jgi:predicted dehydrogenase
MDRYLTQKVNEPGVVRFLDHLCHPASLMVYLLGMPLTLFYQRAANGAGVALFTFSSGAVATISFTLGAPSNTGMERTLVVSDKNRSIEVVNNQRVSYHRNPPDRLGYGNNPYYYQGLPGEASTVWEPEHSLGQLYNKGLFIQGFYHEIREFAASILEKRAPANGTLEQAWQITRIFEAFAQGSNKIIPLI